MNKIIFLITIITMITFSLQSSVWIYDKADGGDKKRWIRSLT